jgi:tetratricopeptide (TPR) repeat protein
LRVTVRRRPRVAWVVAGALLGASGPVAARAFSNVAVGDPLDNPALRTLAGPKVELLSRKAAASVFVFFRPKQDHSLDALRELASVQKELAGKPVRFVGVVSDSWSPDEVREVVAAAGVDWPILIDDGDALYGKLGVRLHPVVGVADRALKLASYEHFRQINFREIVLARLRVLLGELEAADMARVLEPEKATTGSAEAVARRDLNLARALWKRGNGEKALEYARKSLAAAATAGANDLAGQVLAAQGKCAEALPLFDAALKIDPADAVAQQGRKGCGR